MSKEACTHTGLLVSVGSGVAPVYHKKVSLRETEDFWVTPSGSRYRKVDGMPPGEGHPPLIVLDLSSLKEEKGEEYTDNEEEEKMKRIPADVADMWMKEVTVIDHNGEVTELIPSWVTTTEFSGMDYGKRVISCKFTRCIRFGGHDVGKVLRDDHDDFSETDSGNKVVSCKFTRCIRFNAQDFNKLLRDDHDEFKLIHGSVYFHSRIEDGVIFTYIPLSCLKY